MNKVAININFTTKWLVNTFLVLKLSFLFNYQTFSQATLCSCPNSTATRVNLVINGDFEQDFTGFTSDYTLNPTCFPGMYNVTSSPFMATMCNDWGCLDHTNNDINGKFFVADGSLTPGLAAWRETLTLNKNTTYQFCAFANNLNLPRLDRGDPIVEVYIIDNLGNSTLLVSNSLSEFPDEWIQVSGTFTTTTVLNNPYKIEIRTAGTTFEGNNFALDDISFIECSVKQKCDLLCNVDFEDNVLVTAGGFGFFHQDRVDCWNTTATDQLIEIWGSGFSGVPSYSGNQFAELNANQVSTLFQDFIASPGLKADLSFAHRGRAGIDVLRVEVGPVGGPYQSLGNFSAGTSKWEFNSITFNMPGNNTNNYSLRFVSVSAAGGATVGNFLDAISISISKPEVNIEMIPAVCDNSPSGQIIAHVINGSPPYEYNWLVPSFRKDSVLKNVLPGKYILEIIDLIGCTDTINIDLTSLNQSVTKEIYINACDSFYWSQTKKTYASSGQYTDTISSAVKCDSIILLNLNLSNSTLAIENVQSCENYFWPATGKLYTNSGLYTWTGVTKNGCDSTLQLNLEIFPKFINTQKIIACKEYYWSLNNKWYTQSGLYTEILKSTKGCDSIFVLDLTLHNTYEFTEKISACNKYFWPVTNKEYTISGTFLQHFLTSAGCDSNYILILDLNPEQIISEKIKSCKSYLWNVNNTNYVQSGIYTSVFKNIYGCDSIYILNLTIIPEYNTIQNIKACEKYVWPADNITYSLSGSYQKTLTSIENCDSIVQLNLTILNNSKSNTKIDVCEFYVLNNTEYRTSGIYTTHINNYQSCDSSITVDLTIHPKYNQDINLEACERFIDTDGKNYTKSTSITKQLQSQYGCDSIVKLNIVIHDNFTKTDSVISYDPYKWYADKNTYSESGEYFKDFESEFGCDSSYKLILIIKKKGEVYIPNVFSPNGDKLNDHFVIYSNGEIEKIDNLFIYDRWGELVFEQHNFPPDDESFAWDGSFRNKKLSPGVFTYVVEWRDSLKKSMRKSGDVSLIR